MISYTVHLLVKFEILLSLAINPQNAGNLKIGLIQGYILKSDDSCSSQSPGDIVFVSYGRSMSQIKALHIQTFTGDEAGAFFPSAYVLNF